MSISLSPARAAASRRNGAKSQGPRTSEGKARSAQNALKHGLCAQKFVVLGEDAQAFAALEAAVLEELAPEGVLQRLVAGRIVRAAWRLERAERIEAELFAFRMDGAGDLALALIRDGNGTRSFDTLLRYRGSALTEFFRSLRLLQALQAEARVIAVPGRTPQASSPETPNKPETRTDPGFSTPPPRPEEGAAGDAAVAPPARPSYPSPGRRDTRGALPNEPEASDADLAPPPDQPRRAA